MPYTPHVSEPPVRSASRLAPWLVGPLLLCATALGAWIVKTGPDWLLGAALGVVIGTGLVWVLISALFPAEADRVCPSCGEEAIERLDPKTTTGLVCRSCGFQDDSASGWFLAEDEEPELEALVLETRRRAKSGASKRHQRA